MGDRALPLVAFDCMRVGSPNKRHVTSRHVTSRHVTSVVAPGWLVRVRAGRTGAKERVAAGGLVRLVLRVHNMFSRHVVGFSRDCIGLACVRVAGATNNFSTSFYIVFGYSRTLCPLYLYNAQRTHAKFDHHQQQQLRLFLFIGIPAPFCVVSTRPAMSSSGNRNTSNPRGGEGGRGGRGGDRDDYDDPSRQRRPHGDPRYDGSGNRWDSHSSNSSRSNNPNSSNELVPPRRDLPREDPRTGGGAGGGSGGGGGGGAGNDDDYDAYRVPRRTRNPSRCAPEGERREQGRRDAGGGEGPGYIGAGGGEGGP
jgi:hypothetical protein